MFAQAAWSADAPAAPAKPAAKPAAAKPAAAKPDAAKKDAPPAKEAAPVTVSTKEELTAAVKQLEADANTWMAGKGDPGKPVAFTEASIKFLSNALTGGSRKDPVDLYVAWKLLADLHAADANIVKKALPAVESTADHLIKYQDFIVVTADAKKHLAIPTDASLEDTVRLKTAVQKAVADKIVKDNSVKMHNELCGKLEAVVNKLRIQANDSRQDTELVDAAAKAEAQGQTGWVDILTLIDSHVGNMDEKRAKGLYSSLKNWVGKVYYKKGKYRDVNGTPKMVTTDSCAYEAKDMYPGITIATLLKKLADVAKEKDDLPVPTTSEVDAKQKAPAPTPHKSTAKKK